MSERVDYFREVDFHVDRLISFHQSRIARLEAVRQEYEQLHQEVSRTCIENSDAMEKERAQKAKPE